MEDESEEIQHRFINDRCVELSAASLALLRRRWGLNLTPPNIARLAPQSKFVWQLAFSGTVGDFSLAAGESWRCHPSVPSPNDKKKALGDQHKPW